MVSAALAALASNAAAQVPTRVLHSFVSDAADPSSGLIETPDGSFLGVTYAGGDGDLGTIYAMTPNGTVTILHSFAGGTDGAHPHGTLLAAGGAYYGTTTNGGTPDRGTIFKLTPGGAEVVHEFAGSPQGSRPSSRLLLATDGNIYGTTAGGGDFDKGTIYRMTPTGDVTVLYSFPGGLDGESPGGLIQTRDGNFYGSAGGGLPGFLVSGMGLIYRMTSDGQVAVLHRFVGADGIGPGGLVQALDGHLYGVGGAGGNGGGTVFRMTLTGDVTVLHVFSGSPNGWYPSGGLIQGTDGALYGTTSSGGRSFTFTSTGIAYRITTSGVFSPLHVFQGTPLDAAEPRSELLEASDGNLYGTAVYGGWSGDIFRIDTRLCKSSVDLWTVPGTVGMQFSLRTWAPGTWSVWAFYAGGVVKLWSLPIQTTLAPPRFVGISFSSVPVGPLGILSTITTPLLNSMCLDWKVVDTGTPPGSSSSR